MFKLISILRGNVFRIAAEHNFLNDFINGSQNLRYRYSDAVVVVKFYVFQLIEGIGVYDTVYATN
jgi:hypothetical protein